MITMGQEDVAAADVEKTPDQRSKPRRKTRAVRAGNLIIGGGFPISVQTMWKEPLARESLPHVREELESLSRRGCDIIRFAVPDIESADLLGSLSRISPLPIVADIHFDHRIALRCLDYPIAKIRINPGTIGEEGKVREVVAKARDTGASLRIGINAGSLPKNLENRKDQAQAMFEASEIEMNILERLGFHDVVFSLKSSDTESTIRANILFAQTYDYPLHIGITEAGPLVPGIVRNTIGVAALLKRGIGETIRISLSTDPLQEVLTGVEILKVLNQRRTGMTIISCPTCGRSTFDVKGFLDKVFNGIHYQGPGITVAIMGCVVNGPGEARHADIGITGAGKIAVIFRKGEIVRRVKHEDSIKAFQEELELACKKE